MTTGCVGESLGSEVKEKKKLIATFCISLGLGDSLYVLLCILNIIRALAFCYLFSHYLTLEYATIVLLLYQDIHREVTCCVRPGASFCECLLPWFFVSDPAFPIPVFPSRQFFLFTFPSMVFGSRQLLPVTSSLTLGRPLSRPQ